MQAVEIENWIVTRIATELDVPKDTIDRDTALTSLGLDSISMLSLAGELAEYTNIEIQVSFIWEFPTIASLSKAITARAVYDTNQTTSPTACRAAPLPLTHAQLRVWKYANHAPAGDANTILHCWKLQGTLDVGTLESSLNAIISRHEILRTSFTTHEGEPAQIVHPPQDRPLTVVDFTQESQPTEAALRALRQEEKATMQIEGGQLFQVRLHKLSENEHHLLFKLHHLLYDANSLVILYTQLSDFYNTNGQAVRDLPLPMQVVDYATWQREHLDKTGDAYQKMLKWWLTHWSAAPRAQKLTLPCKRKHIAPSAATSDNEITASIPDQQFSQIQALTTQAGTTSFVILFAVFNALLYILTRNKIITSGVYVSDRNKSAVNQSMGFFVNLLALKTPINEQPTLLSLIHTVDQTLAECSVHQQLPFETLVEELEAIGQKRPRVEVIFQQMPAIGSQLNLRDILAEKWDQATPNNTLWGLTVDILTKPDELGIRVRFDPTRYERSKVNKMLEQYLTLIEKLTDTPDLIITPKGRFNFWTS